MNSVKIVENFWDAVWKARSPDAARDLVVDDFVITTNDVDLVGKENFVAWIKQFLGKIKEFQFEVLETFQNEDGSRVASRWRVTGRNNGFFGPEPNQKPISFTGTAIWAVREDGKLLHNWVERSAWEAYQQLTKG